MLFCSDVKGQPTAVAINLGALYMISFLQGLRIK